MRRTPRAALVFGLLAVASAGGASPVREVVAPKAQAFAMADVHLSEGPFYAAMLRDQAYLLSLDLDRLLHTFRVNAGLPSSARPLGGWEAPDVELRGHSLGHFLSATALMYSATGDGRFKVRADAVVEALAQVQAAAATRYHAGYLSAFPEELFDRLEKRQRVWAPYYTIHKIMAGLLEAHLMCGNGQALEVLRKQADWVKLRMDGLTDEQRQAALQTEFGGMNEVLANLYAVTGDPEHLRLARLFDHRAVFDPLARREDQLDGLHANTQIPKAIGAAREYELTGEARYREIASFFWERVAQHRSYVTGGHSDGEHFFPVDRFRDHLSADTAETCNTYNMLKLTRHLFQWSPSAELMDFYERALLNHILASQDPATGMVIYYCPLKPGAFRSYSKPDDSFWCCVGTGMENHAKYADTIYLHDDHDLYVNLFIPSKLTWREKGLVLRQETRFPSEDTTRLTIERAESTRLGLKIRWPAWAQAGMRVRVNDRDENIRGTPGSYVTIDRDWRKDDVVEVRLPMSLRLETLPGDPGTVALLFGPVVLAGDLGREGLADSVRFGPAAPPLRRVPPLEVPAFVGDVGRLLERVRPVAGKPLNFRTEGLGRPRDVSLLPFYEAGDNRYSVYWSVYSPVEWEAHQTALRAVGQRRRALEARTLDTVDIDNPQSERDHRYSGEKTDQWEFEGRKCRQTQSGWFSYELKVRGDQPMTLAFTYRGSEGRPRTFDVLVNGQTVATKTAEYHPTELLDAVYAIPESLTREKEHVTVKFEARSEAGSAEVFEVRIVKTLAGPD